MGLLEERVKGRTIKVPAGGGGEGEVVRCPYAPQGVLRAGDKIPKEGEIVSDNPIGQGRATGTTIHTGGADNSGGGGGEATADKMSNGSVYTPRDRARDTVAVQQPVAAGQEESFSDQNPVREGGTNGIPLTN